MAYISENRFGGLRDGDFERLSIVNFAFAVVRGGVASVAHWQNSAAVREFIKNKGHIKVVLSVGGWGAGGFSPMAANPSSRAAFARSIADIVGDFGFDGVDLDWEYPCDSSAGIESSPDDKANFTALVALLRETLGNDKIISMAAGASPRCVGNLEIEKIAPIMDLFNIMTYDMADWGRTSHHTSLYKSRVSRSICADEAVRGYVAAGVPAEKITIGAAFYARVFNNVERGEHDGLDQVTDGGPPSFSNGYRGAKDLVQAAGGGFYDEDAEAPYAYDAAKKIFITYDDERSVGAKREYAEKTGLGGVMFWEYNCDDAGSSLLRALNHG